MLTRDFMNSINAARLLLNKAYSMVNDVLIKILECASTVEYINVCLLTDIQLISKYECTIVTVISH